MLSAVAFSVALGFGIVAPAIPLFAKHFDVDNTQAVAVVSAFALMRLISAPFAGRLVDRLGERVMLATGIGIVGRVEPARRLLAVVRPARAAARRRRRGLGDVHRLGVQPAAAGGRPQTSAAGRRARSRPASCSVASPVPLFGGTARHVVAARPVLPVRRHACCSREPSRSSTSPGLD